MNNSDTKKRTGALLMALFALVSGAIIFFPTAYDVIHPPFIVDLFLFGFWFIGVISLILLGISIYLIRFTTRESIPHRLNGPAVFLAVGALICLGIYLVANIVSDRSAEVNIVSIDIAPISPKPGETVRFTGNVIDQDFDDIRYTWLVNGTEIGDTKVVYWPSPHNEETYEVILRADDGNAEHKIEKNISLVVKEGGVTKMSNSGELIRASIARSFSVIQEHDPDLLKRILETYNEDKLPGLVAQNMDPNDPSTIEMLVGSAFLRAIEVIPEDKLESFLEGSWRPCCSAYPAIWPFCDPSC